MCGLRTMVIFLLWRTNCGAGYFRRVPSSTAKAAGSCRSAGAGVSLNLRLWHPLTAAFLPRGDEEHMT